MTELQKVTAPRPFSWAGPTAAAAPPAAPAAPAADSPQGIANQAMADMKDAYKNSPEEAAQVGLKYATMIANQAGAGAEKPVAQITIDCVNHLSTLPAEAPKASDAPPADGAQPAMSPSNAAASVVALVGCFRAIAAATGGPIGQLIAQAGLAGMTNSMPITPAQADVIGLYSVHGLEVTAGTSPSQQILGKTARSVYDVLNDVSEDPDVTSTCAKVLRTALNVASQDSMPPVNMALAQAGFDAMYNQDYPIWASEADLIGLGYAHAIKDNSPADQAAAASVISAYSDAAARGGDDSARIGAKILGDFLGNIAGVGAAPGGEEAQPAAAKATA